MGYSCVVQKGPHGVLRPITWSTLIVGYSTYSHRVRAHARARECALPSCSDASEVAVAFTAAPHRATTFAFSATRADIFVVRSENAAASSVFAAASFAFCAVSASILAAHLRRARQDWRGALSATWHVARFVRHGRQMRCRSHGCRRTLLAAAPSARGARPSRPARRAAKLASR